MHDPRLTRLADILVNYSTRLEPGQNVLIEATGIGPELVKELVKKASEAGANA